MREAKFKIKGKTILVKAGKKGVVVILHLRVFLFYTLLKILF